MADYAMMDRGCGWCACTSYATGLRAEHVANDGAPSALVVDGEAIATGCKHHQSVARVVKATITPEAGEPGVERLEGVHV